LLLACDPPIAGDPLNIEPSGLQRFAFRKKKIGLALGRSTS
jgi:hypothetical protein